MQVKNAEIHFFTKKAFGSIVQSNPYVDKIHLLDDSLKTNLDILKREEFDYIIDLHHNLRTLRVKAALRVKSFSFDKLNLEKWLMTALKVNRLPDEHIVDRYLATLKPFGVKNDGLGLDYFIPEKDRVVIHALPNTHQNGFIALVIGAARATKQLPFEKLLKLCQNLSPHPIIALGGPSEGILGEKLSSSLSNVWNACGKMNLNQSADLIRLSKVVITHDTGLMHIAAAFKKPIVSIWGNTIPAFGMAPYFPVEFEATNEIFEVKPLNCRPCSKIGYEKCPNGHFNCMEKQDIEVISGKATQIFNSII